jgi:hypothetical protein
MILYGSGTVATSFRKKGYFNWNREYLGNEDGI